MLRILQSVQLGELSPEDAVESLRTNTRDDGVDTRLQEFANLDHARSRRTGFPEVVFAENKTVDQVRAILEDMARHAKKDSSASSAILATRYVPKSETYYTPNDCFP